jgi:hypothetical protein
MKRGLVLGLSGVLAVVALSGCTVTYRKLDPYAALKSDPEWKQTSARTDRDPAAPTGAPAALASPAPIPTPTPAPMPTPRPAAPPAPAPASPAAAAFMATAPQPTAFALVVGIDRYRDVPAAPGARADAERFAQLVRQTMGLKDDHVRTLLEDHATRADVLRGLTWLKSSVPPGGRAYFFFSGHGAPAVDQSTYLVPYDADSKDIAATGVPMADVMKTLGESPAKEAIAFVDACFSGAGGRSIMPPGARPLMRVKEATPTAHVAFFSASRGEEISGPAPGESAGLFTKMLTTGLGLGQADMDGDGQISLQEIADWVGPRVAREAKRDNREQHPSLVVGSAVGRARDIIVEYGVASK